MKHIEMTDFSAYYKLKKEYAVALDNISFAVDEGEFVTLMGPSGCGKTTLLKCILGQVGLTKGEVLLHGEEPTKDVIKKENIAYVAQDFSLYNHLNIYENIAFPLRIAELDPEEVDRRVRAMAQKCGLPAPLLNRKPRQLSLGQQQRVVLARAFIKEPKHAPRKRLLYRWPVYVLGIVALIFVLSTAWENLTKPAMNEKLSVCFVGQDFRDAEAQTTLSESFGAFTAQPLKDLTAESIYYDNGNLMAEALTVRCVGETDFIILEDDYLIEEIGSRYFSEIPAEIVQQYFPEAVTYQEDGRVYGICVYSPEEEITDTGFSEFYDGSNSCWLFFTIVSENTAGMNGKGTQSDTAALDLAAYLWRTAP